MKGKALILIVIIVAILAAAGWWFMRPPSPSGKASISHNGLDVSISYSRPYKKGRIIFGEASSGALQPNGQYWRLGANAASEITFSRDVSFAGKPVKAGTYRIYAVPGASYWQIILNSELGKSGSETPDKNRDVVSVEVPYKEGASVVEQFTIEFRPGSAGVVMDLKWDRAEVAVEIA